MSADPLADLADLEQALSEVARSLFAPKTVEGVLQRIVDQAAATVEGCDLAGLLLVRDGHVTTSAATHPTVTELDRLQSVSGEGPCLDAASSGGIVYAFDLVDDPRWPRFGPAATAIGIRSALALQVATSRASALNLYSRLPGAFGANDRAKAVLFATLAGLALGSAEEREVDEKRSVNLQAALATRELIGQAQGILMERERITAADAFHVLRRASQHLNVKLRDIAQTLVDTGETGEPSSHPVPERREAAGGTGEA
jgi:hypothetical protein